MGWVCVLRVACGLACLGLLEVEGAPTSILVLQVVCKCGTCDAGGEGQSHEGVCVSTICT